MNNSAKAILAITIAAISVTLLASNSMLPSAFMIAQGTVSTNTQDEPVGYLGHVTYVVKDANGNIKSYAQTDNQRTTQGINCAEQILFGTVTQGKIDTNGTNLCNGMNKGGALSFNGFNVIGLINGTNSLTNRLNGSDTYATIKLNGANACGTKCGLISNGGSANTGIPAQGTVAGVTCANSGGVGTCYNQVTITSPTFNFNQILTSMTIRGSVLLNSTGTSPVPNMFAENALSPTVTVGPSDTLTVTWTITLT